MSVPRPQQPAEQGFFRSPGWWLVIFGVVLALVPWWRNHGYLRDLYDYGLVIAANGHLDLGARPYVDFTTPIQAGFLGLNWWIERLGGGTYFGLTLGGAGLIVVTVGVLMTMLAQRWPWWQAALVGWTVAVAGASQHTILWHNSLGLSCLAVVTWAAACAPVWRRETWPWHALLAAGLFLSGINKLNFHLVAVAAALAWSVRAGLLRQSSWSRVGVTGLSIIFVGVVLPVAVELAWTGASLSLWLANVVQVASGSRLEILGKIFSTDFLLRPIHDYYGPLPLQQVGLVGGWFSLAVLVGCWPERSAPAGSAGWDRWLLPLAVALAAAAAAALLATNFEIASIGLGGWLVLSVSLWLGFAPTGRRAVFIGGVLLPAVALGAVAWWSAWQGQRSQFGFSSAPRAEYRPATEAGPAFAGLAGLRLPPDFVASLAMVAQSLPEADPESTGADSRPVFYGPGLEFVQRFLPGPWEKGQPLWNHWNTTYSPAHRARLAARLGEQGDCLGAFALEAFDEWPPDIRAPLERQYTRDHVGPRIVRWLRRDRHHLDLADGFATLAALGGNVDGRVLHADTQPLRTWQRSDGKWLLGISRRDGSVLLRTPANRFRGVAVLQRLPAAGDRPLFADFRATIHGSVPEETRWAARVELPAGQSSIEVPFEADAGGRALLLWVRLPPETAAVTFGGFREMEITHAVESAAVPRLRPDSPADAAVAPGSAESLFGAVAWRPQELVVRGNATPADEGLQLAAGGELWLHTEGMSGEIRGRLESAGPGAPVLARVVWYKGGRLQVLQNGWIMANQPLDFRAWTAEPGGWFGIVLSGGAGAAPTQVRVTDGTVAP